MGIVLGLMLAVAFTSCHKDKTGVYAPKKKIQQIYYSWSDTEKKPFQHWEWNGDKLNSITHYSDFDFKADTWVENFTYDNNNRVTRVDNYTNSEYITYEYDGNHLKTATVFYRNAIACTWAISYDGDKISKMMGTFYDDFKKDGATLHLNPLSHLLPPNVCKSVAQCEQRRPMRTTVGQPTRRKRKLHHRPSADLDGQQHQQNRLYRRRRIHGLPTAIRRQKLPLVRFHGRS